MENIGKELQNAFEGVRSIIVLASRAKAPQEDLGVALAPYLAPTQEAVKNIRGIRVGRDFDRHQKAIIEMLSALSWIIFKAPKQLPAPFVKETLGSAEFWSNRVRKDYKGKDDTQIAFCDGLRKTITGLAEYIEEYHKPGLTFNPKGMSLTEAGLRLSDEPETQQDVIKSPVQRSRKLGTVVPGGNLAGLMSELNTRKNADGSSAATGLKHVSIHDAIRKCWYSFVLKPDRTLKPIDFSCPPQHPPFR